MANDVGHIASQSTLQAKAKFLKLDETRLATFIASQPDVMQPVRINNVMHKTDGAGASNGITFFDAHYQAKDGQCRHSLVARYSPGVTLLKQKTFADEFATLKVALEAGLPVPRPFWLDESGQALGHPGFIMERVVGECASTGLLDKGLLAEADPASRKSMMLAAARFHGELRRVALSAEDLPHLVNRGTGNSAIQRELNWWLEEIRLAEPLQSHTDEIRQVHRWLIEHEPKAYTPNLVHGDAQFANLIFTDRKLRAAIDWELSYLGHNESDLAGLVFAAQLLNDGSVEGVPSEAEFIAEYERASGHAVQHWKYFMGFNIYKWMVCAVLIKSEGLLAAHRGYLRDLLNDFE